MFISKLPPGSQKAVLKRIAFLFFSSSSLLWLLLLFKEGGDERVANGICSVMKWCADRIMCLLAVGFDDLDGSASPHFALLHFTFAEATRPGRRR